MAPPKSNRLRSRMRTLFPPKFQHSTARESRFVQRQRKLDLSAFLWTLVLGFGCGGGRSYVGLYEIYLAHARRRLSESAFFEWLAKPGFPSWMRALAEHAIREVGEDTGNRLRGVLGQFAELFVVDATIVRLQNALADRFPAAGSKRAPAALKVHVIQRAGGGGLHRVQVTEGKRAESRTFRLGPWVRGGLLLMDLGFYCFRRFARIKELGGFFVSRVKTSANPVILRCLRTHRGRAVKVEGERLQDVLRRLKRKLIDIEVEVAFYRRAWRGQRRRDTMKLRLVGVWNVADRQHHLFFTNLTPDQATTQQVADLYRLRWEIELFFRELKSVYKLSDLPGENPDTVVAMVYASILSSLLTRRLLRHLQEVLGLEDTAMTYEQAARIFQRHAGDFLTLVLLGGAEARLWERHVVRTLKAVMKRRAKGRLSLQSELVNLRGHPTLPRLAA